jgi:AAA15 family ATPase/GTPase
MLAMINEVHVKGFRGLQDFTMSNLGRINLLVGTNNSGKSSILEAIELISSKGSVRPIWSATSRRGERLWFDDDSRRYTEADVSHLFYSHRFAVGSKIEICTRSEASQNQFSMNVVTLPEGSIDPGQDVPTSELSDQLGLELEWNNRLTRFPLLVPLTPRNGLSNRYINRSSTDRIYSPPVQFISTAALSPDEVLSLFDEVVLSPEEDLLVDALRTIEPDIERIASIGSDRSRFASIVRQGNIVVKLFNHRDRIPIGSMGDGIWRMLGIALSLVSAKDGILLIDEIDTGLHYSVLTKMWHLVKTTSERLNVQVFATTHSRDCYESLASISREGISDGSTVTIQRVEKNSKTAISFSEQEIVAASERGIEVR